MEAYQMIRNKFQGIFSTNRPSTIVLYATTHAVVYCYIICCILLNYKNNKKNLQIKHQNN